MQEKYTHGHAPATLRQHGQRTADEAAAFLLPHLRPGMSLLDVGCGPGSITRGLADRLSPGRVVGLDPAAEVLDAARRDAAQRQLTNLHYETGTVYALPFADATFDVVYAHQFLQHLARRGEAMQEMLRVLAPGGLVAVREVDWATVAYYPEDPWIDRFIETHFKTWYRNGGEPRMGRRLRALFNASALEGVEITATVWCYAAPDATTMWGDSYAERLLTSPMGARAVEYGFATQADLEAMAAALRSWGGHPDAFWSFTQVAALGRKPA